MNSLYRCRCRIAYRPYSSDKLIVFEERQVESVGVNLQWNPNSLSLNQDSAGTGATQFASALTGSTCNVTLTDPYLTGAAWAALFDMAAAYTNSSNAAANYILLPSCAEGESPASGKCRVYPTIEDPNLRVNAYGDFAHILVTLYYDVAGTKFGLDMYFRLQGLRIEHGKTYPKVTLQGIDPQTVVLNQSLTNFKLEENKTLEENLQKILEEYDLKASFCTDSTAGVPERYVMPRTFKEKNVTAGEIVQKYVESVGGSVRNLPIREYARKISLCTRANINQGCSVFYLGKGLYEGYSISGNTPTTLANLNTEFNAERQLGYSYDSVPLADNEKYTLDPIYPEKRQARFRNIDKPATFGSDQFAQYNKRYSDSYSTSGSFWRGNGPGVTTERRDRVNLYGAGPFGTTAKAMLDGVILSPTSADFGRVVIGTNYFIKYCDGAEPKKCRNSAIYQESVNLITVSEGLKVGTRVEIGQEIGTSTAEKPEFVRFFLAGAGRGREITLDPALVWRYAVPTGKLTAEELKSLGLKGTEDTPSSGSTQPGQSSQEGGCFGRMGNTGYSNGAHLHIQWAGSGGSRARGSLITIDDVKKYITLNGRTLTPASVSSKHEQEPGGRGGHRGIDIATGFKEGDPVGLINGAVLQQVVVSNCSPGDSSCGGRLGNYIRISTPDGDMEIGHLYQGSLNCAKPGTTGSSTGSKYGTGVQSGAGMIGAEVTTEFRGIPRALRIVPGRTVLNFVTRYDEWVEKGRPKDIDPGVWIAGRFSKWLVKTVNYNWSQGDLRVSITGITDWGAELSRIRVPTFEQYLQQFESEFDQTKDYYGYIRSLGDLCWKYDKTRTSCEVLCEEAQRVEEFYGTGLQQGEADPSVNGSYPRANCQYVGTRYPKDRVNAIINAARQGGINTKAGYAGVVGNALVESFDRLDPSADNKNPRFIDEFGRGCIGIFQWCDRKKGLYALSKSTGKPWNDFNLQMQWFVKELQSTESRTVPAMNAANGPAKAADEFDRLYERSGGQKAAERRNKAIEIFNDLRCEGA